jgi:hypothetical protein
MQTTLVPDTYQSRYQQYQLEVCPFSRLFETTTSPLLQLQIDGSALPNAVIDPIESLRKSDASLSVRDRCRIISIYWLSRLDNCYYHYYYLFMYPVTDDSYTLKLLRS